MRQDDLRALISYVPQKTTLFTGTIADNIRYGNASASDDDVVRAAKDAAAYDFIMEKEDGFDTQVTQAGGGLSGGQKQRVAIARALIHNRSILLVDEGTSALDQKNADIVEKSLLSNPDLTLILISHHLSDERKAQFDHVYELTPASSIV